MCLIPAGNIFPGFYIQPGQLHTLLCCRGCDCDTRTHPQLPAVPQLLNYNLMLVLLSILMATAVVAEEVRVPCPIVMDVRSSSDYSTAHVSCAVNVPAATLDAWIEDNKDDYKATQPFYPYCYRGVLSLKAKNKLVAKGFSNSENGGGYEAAKDDLEEVCVLQKKCQKDATETIDKEELPRDIHKKSGCSSCRGSIFLSLTLALIVGCAAFV